MQISLGPYRRSLRRYESAFAYAVLGIVGGLASGFAVIAFEYAIHGLAGLWQVNRGETFETLPRLWIFALPTLGGIALGVAFSLLRPQDRDVGLIHLISRLHSHYGVLPLRNALVQFFGGMVALASGQSGGREGPGVHLGGAINSLLGQALALPHSSLRVLIACGTAGGIAAAFNTPLAGVIFAMEVVLMEYTIAGFLPVMLAAVTAAAVSQGIGSLFPAMQLASGELASLWEMPFVLVVGLCCGCVGALFIRLSTLSARLTAWPVIMRFSLAGLLTGVSGLLVPQVLGMGHDSLAVIIAGGWPLGLLAMFAAAKLLTASVSVGLGLPVGLIGPSLLIGACVGGLLGHLGGNLMPQLSSDPALYVTIGMAACMATVVGAPLAASLAVVELTQSTSIAVPALLAIVVANLTNVALFRQRSVHESIMRQLERRVPNGPLDQFLHRTDATLSMDTSVVHVPVLVTASALRALTLQVPTWCLIQREDEDLFLLNGSDLLAWAEQQQAEDEPSSASSADDDEAALDLAATDIRRWTTTRLSEQATLREALDAMRQSTVETACIYSRTTRGTRNLRGVVTREGIEHFSLARLNSQN
ncbi:chloride channel protein [Chromatocurvus halotolerans]|uniref:H+/Cl-antiporter ClcA n=1 Tax=Chromatocurvus halotolerans TaxID=1132028 RepID=A0A4V2SAQ4_9GAMM|nr:chloride channel protein [Chromatocurvus halotolerans]TCO71890.1 H+/Cl- antiporter ClcA [Chromatocurvus halotolerans]